MRDGAFMELEVVVVIIFEQDCGCKAGLLGLASCRSFLVAPTLELTPAFSSEFTARVFKKPGSVELRVVDGVVDEFE